MCTVDVHTPCLGCGHEMMVDYYFTMNKSAYVIWIHMLSVYITNKCLPRAKAAGCTPIRASRQQRSSPQKQNGFGRPQQPPCQRGAVRRAAADSLQRQGDSVTSGRGGKGPSPSILETSPCSAPEPPGCFGWPHQCLVWTAPSAFSAG